MQFTINIDPAFKLTGGCGCRSAYDKSPTVINGVETFVFPGGEVQTRLSRSIESAVTHKDWPIIIATRLTNAEKVMELGQVVDILKRKDYTNISALIPYIPYMQQDRVMTDGEDLDYSESFALSVFARILNTFGLKKVYCVDPHSTVTNDAMINGLNLISNYPYLYKAITGGQVSADVDYFVSPDEGAIKKTLKYSKSFKIPYIVSFKQRDVGTGKIVGVNLPKEEGEKIRDKTVLIADDICVGGKTFVELAKELRKYSPKKIKLYVSHGLFTQGTVLEGIDEIYCTNSCRSFDNTEKFTMFPIIIPNV